MLNKYFEGFKTHTEENLVEDCIIEAIQIHGLDFYYIPRTSLNPDLFLNEAPNASFDSYTKIEMYVENAESYGGSNYYLQQLGAGLIADRTLDLTISKKRFKLETGTPIPLEGDLVYNHTLQSLFEITFIDINPPTSGLYLLQKLYTYNIKCSLFTYSHEDFNTSIPELDEQMTDLENADPFAKNVEINNEAELDLEFNPLDPYGNDLIE